MEQPPLEANLTVAEVLTRWPQTIPVFIHQRMACVGCVIAPFETLAEVAVVYHLDLDCFLRELQQAIDKRLDKIYPEKGKLEIEDLGGRSL